jgi:hypothetical protein
VEETVMLEAKLRQIHRTVGIYLVGFLALQALTGLLMALGTLMGTGNALWYTIMQAIHYDWNPLGSAYRVLLGVMTVGQGLGGLCIYLLIRARLAKTATAPPKP